MSFSQWWSYQWEGLLLTGLHSLFNFSSFSWLRVFSLAPLLHRAPLKPLPKTVSQNCNRHETRTKRLLLGVLCTDPSWARELSALSSLTSPIAGGGLADGCPVFHRPERALPGQLHQTHLGGEQPLPPVPY